MLESGVLLMIERYSDYILTLESSKRIRENIRQEEISRIQPLQMIHWKIVSIFIGWGFLLSTSLVVFTLEIISPAVVKHLKHSTMFTKYAAVLQKAVLVILSFRAAMLSAINGVYMATMYCHVRVQCCLRDRSLI